MCLCVAVYTGLTGGERKEATQCVWTRPCFCYCISEVNLELQEGASHNTAHKTHRTMCAALMADTDVVSTGAREQHGATRQDGVAGE